MIRYIMGMCVIVERECVCVLTSGAIGFQSLFVTDAQLQIPVIVSS